MKPQKFYNLFLDDFRAPADCMYYHNKYMPQNKAIYAVLEWVVAKNYEDFVSIVESRFEKGEFPVVVSFDHDLADEHYAPHEYHDNYEKFESLRPFTEKTGNECAKWLVQFCIDRDLELPDSYVHSMNPNGTERIKQSLNDYQKYKERFQND